jgi:hypothetical protein
MVGPQGTPVAAVTEEEGSEGQERVAGKPVRNRWKRGEPQGRNRVQHPGTFVEEEAVEVVRNHEDGTRSRLVCAIRRVDDGDIGDLPSGLRERDTTEGRTLTTPEEASDARASEGQDRNASRKRRRNDQEGGTVRRLVR